jgi:hypothetical protein
MFLCNLFVRYKADDVLSLNAGGGRGGRGHIHFPFCFLKMTGIHVHCIFKQISCQVFIKILESANI